MNPAAILTLISELYTQVATLAEENKKLREEIAKATASPPAN